MRKPYIALAASLFFGLTLLAFVSVSSAITISMVNGSCTGGTVCLFSMNQTNNSHAGECGYFNVSVCGDFTSAAIRTGSCNSDESGVLVLFQRNDSHVGAFGTSNYGNTVCVGGSYTATTRGGTSCNDGETILVSINATNNSHVASAGYFGNQVCLIQLGPVITVQSPTNTSYSTTSVWANATLDKAGSAVLRSLDSGSNVSLTNSSGNWNNQMTGLSDGPHNIKIYANDTSGNQATPVNVNFTVDTTAPTITTQSPTNTTIGTSSVWANATLNEAGSAVLRSLDSGSNVSLTNSSGNWNNQITGLSGGPHSVRFYANDTAGNIASPVTVFFTADLTGPTITVTLPTNTTYRTKSVQNSITLSESGDWCGRSLDSGSNVTMTNSSATSWSDTMSGLGKGPHSVSFYCNDTFGNMAASSAAFFTVSVDTLVITGQSLYTATGVLVTSGTVKGTILETGDSNYTTIAGNNWQLSIDTTSNFNANRIPVGVFINDTAGKSGYYRLFVGSGSAPTLNNTCVFSLWRFNGIVSDLTGSLSSSGNATVDIEGTSSTNITSYSNGFWEVHIRPCLVPGNIFKANIRLTDSTGKTGLITLNHVAK